MQLKNCTPVIFVKDIKISRDFYCGVLGFAIDQDFGKNVIFRSGFAIWEIRDDNIIPSTLGREKLNNSSYNRFELYFETEELPEVFEELKRNDVRFLHEVHEEPWGQNTIRFFDPDSHLVEIGESMRQFVSRLYDQGLTVEQVSKRTSVPEDEVRKLIGLM
jgi:catechol 2,3-dioxygenase-like lactoylglutathione lyase family enzyme